MGPVRRTSAVLIVALLLAPAAFAGLDSATQDQIRKDLLSRKFVAKVDLYQAEVLEEGQADSEQDDEAIRIEFPIVIESVSFHGMKIRIRMKHPDVNEITCVDSLFQQPLSADLGKKRESVEKMLGAVFEEKTGEK